MSNRLRFYLLFFLIIFISGCAHVISKDLRAKTDPSLTFGEVFKNPDTYKGKMVIWGGEIIQSILQKNGTTLIEVLDRPLGWRGKPKKTVAFHGKFLVLVKEHADSDVYERGKKITVAGEILGEIQGDKIEHLTEKAYRYPLMLEKQIHAWKRSYQYSTPYPPQVHDPFYQPRGMGILRY
jgi:outer membrane lipoprotein